MRTNKVMATVPFRDDDGQLALVQATDASPKSAERALKENLSLRDNYAGGYGEVPADSSFGKLAEVWLDDLDADGASRADRRSGMGPSPSRR